MPAVLRTAHALAPGGALPHADRQTDRHDLPTSKPTGQQPFCQYPAVSWELQQYIENFYSNCRDISTSSTLTALIRHPNHLSLPISIDTANSRCCSPCLIAYSVCQAASYSSASVGAKLHYTDTGYEHRLRTPPTDKLTTILCNKFATSQFQSPTSRHVKILGCGKFLSVGGVRWWCP